MKDNIYVFGHRNPDTDSVTSAIALSYLKKKQGIRSIKPAVLSDTNLETKYVLNYLSSCFISISSSIGFSRITSEEVFDCFNSSSNYSLFLWFWFFRDTSPIITF